MQETSKKPALRFAGFNDAWEQRKVSDIASDTRGGGTPATSNEAYWKGDIPWIQSSDLSEGRLYGVKPRKYISQAGLHNSATQLVPEDSIAVVTRVGVGKLAFLPYSYATSQDFLSLCKLRVEPYFSVYGLYHVLQGELQAVQGTSIKGMTKEDLLSKSISIPVDIAEQTQIGAYFKNLDDLITLHQRKYTKLMNIKKSMLDKMFPKDGASVPEIRFAGFTDAWEQRKLSEIVEVCSGHDYKHLSEGDIPVYGTGGYMLSVNDALSYDRDAVGIGRKGTIDKPYVLKAPFWTVDTLFYAVPEHSECLDFVHDLFQIIDWKKKDESTGVPSLSKEAINNTEVMVPQIGEQLAIGGFFARIDNLITLHQRELERLQNIKKSCLEKMFV